MIISLAISAVPAIVGVVQLTIPMLRIWSIILRVSAFLTVLRVWVLPLLSVWLVELLIMMR